MQNAPEKLQLWLIFPPLHSSLQLQNSPFLLLHRCHFTFPLSAWSQTIGDLVVSAMMSCHNVANQIAYLVMWSEGSSLCFLGSWVWCFLSLLLYYQAGHQLKHYIAWRVGMPPQLLRECRNASLPFPHFAYSLMVERSLSWWLLKQENWWVSVWVKINCCHPTGSVGKAGGQAQG